MRGKNQQVRRNQDCLASVVSRLYFLPMRNGLILLVFWLCLLGCEQQGAAISDPTLTALPTAAPTIDSVVPEVTVEGNGEPARYELRVWVAPTISVDAPQSQPENPLQTQLDTFATAHPDLTIDLRTKSISEQGGILSYLRTGHNIAPNVLPDLVALPSDQLERAVSDGLVYPIADLVNVEGTFAAGQDLGQINNVQYGYPFLITDFYHLAYNPNVVTGIFARRWADFSTLERAEMILPAASHAGADLLLQLYHGANGSVTDGEAAFQFQSPPLTTALNDIQRGVADGFLLSSSADLTNESAAWDQFQSGAATIIYLNAETFLKYRSQGNGSSFAPLPTNRATATPVVRGWVWAITTPNVERQALAAELIAYLTNSQNLGAYSSTMLIPPATLEAFDAWQVNAYTTFLQTQLSAAVAYPSKLSPNNLNTLTEVTTALLRQEISADAAIEQINNAAVGVP